MFWNIIKNIIWLICLNNFNTSRCQFVFVQAWKEMSPFANQYARRGDRSYAKKSSGVHLASFSPNWGPNDTSNDLMCSWPGQMVGLIGFLWFGKKKNEWNPESLNKNCEDCLICWKSLEGRIEGSKPWRTINKDSAALLEGNHRLYELHKNTLLALTSSRGTRAAGWDKHTIP